MSLVKSLTALVSTYRVGVSDVGRLAVSVAAPGPQRWCSCTTRRCTWPCKSCTMSPPGLVSSGSYRISSRRARGFESLEIHECMREPIR